MRPRAVVRELLHSGPGRVGLVLAVILLSLSAWVLITYPLDYGPARWSDPTAWADYPKAAAPAWTTLFGGSSAVQRDQTATEPTSTRTSGAAQVLTYDQTFDYQQDTPPTFMSFSLGEVQFQDRAPSLAVSLIRPDGNSVVLYRASERGPRPGEQPVYVRNADEPERVLLSAEETTAQATADMLAKAYGVTVAASDLEGHPEGALFGVPDGNGGFTPLKGQYTLETRVATANPADQIASIRTVLGGSVYGLMGTDTQGRDLAEGLLFGLPIALLIGITTAIIATLIGTALGLLSGFRGGRTDLLVQRAADVVNNVPLLPLLIFIVFVLGAQLWLILLVLVAFSWPGLTITIRSMVLGHNSSQEVEAARATGASDRRILFRHVFPHTAPFVFTTLIFLVPGAILAEAGLAFLGLGDPSLPTWGQVLQDGFQTGAVFLGYWWWVVAPGVLIAITSLTFMLLALGLEAVVDPRLRRSAT
jgi:peptide/nickel transport system permease protein